MSVAGAIKKVTGLTGLRVAKTPHHTLTVIYGKLLRTLQKMPPDAAYRKYTEDLITSRAAIVKSCQTVKDIEEKINCGQVEEIIIQAENELSLARNMLNWKPWEPLIATPPPNQWTWPPTKAT